MANPLRRTPGYDYPYYGGYASYGGGDCLSSRVAARYGTTWTGLFPARRGVPLRSGVAQLAKTRSSPTGSKSTGSVSPNRRRLTSPRPSPKFGANFGDNPARKRRSPAPIEHNQATLRGPIGIASLRMIAMPMAQLPTGGRGHSLHLVAGRHAFHITPGRWLTFFSFLGFLLRD